MATGDQDEQTTTSETGQPEPTPERPFRNAMIIVIGFGVAVTLTGLLTIGLIEFAQSIGWWERSAR
jgi:hypothetical protein